jgi:hypothetical protein
MSTKGPLRDLAVWLSKLSTLEDSKSQTVDVAWLRERALAALAEDDKTGNTTGTYRTGNGKTEPSKLVFLSSGGATVDDLYLFDAGEASLAVQIVAALNA